MVYKHFTESYTRSTLVEFLDSEELAALEECDSDQFQHGGVYLSAKAASDDAEESAAVNEMLNDAYCHGVGFYQEESKTEVRMALQEMNGDELADQAFEHLKATILEQARAFEEMRSDPFLHGGVESAEEVRAFSDMMADKNVCGSFNVIESTSAPTVGDDDEEMFFEGVDIEGRLNDIPVIENLRRSLVSMGVESMPRSDSNSALDNEDVIVSGEKTEGKLSRSPSGVALCDLSAY